MFAVLRPLGTMVCIGNGSDPAIPLSVLVAKEINILGSFRFDAEFALAARLIDSGRADVAPLISDVLPMAEAVRAFELAGDRGRAMKVQLAFDA